MISILLFINTLLFPIVQPFEHIVTKYSPIEMNFYPLNNLKVDFRLVKPSTNDEIIQLCIPAAFTSPDNKPEGLIYLNGVKKSEFSPKDGRGALFISFGKCEILTIEDAVNFTKKPKNNFFSVFQQHHIIRNSKSYENPFRNRKLQMRVIATIKNKLFVIESAKEIDSEKFINHLLDIGVTEALYLDMGSWSEGWYRNENGVIVKIGLNRRNTHRQTNWLLFHK